MARTFRIAAISVPVVYTPEGDHDPNGMVFIPQALVPLLKWCRDLWYDGKPGAEEGPETLPRLHHRRQRARLVIDLLERLDRMVERLRVGTPEDQALLARTIARELLEEVDAGHHYLSDPHHEPDDQRRYHATDRDRAVRMNFERTLAELTIALTDLQRTGGLPQWDATDDRYDPVERRGVQSALADAEERAVPRPVRLASLTARQRDDLREHWLVQEKIIDDAIDAWFVRHDTSAGSQALQDAAAKGKVDPVWIPRLIFNDHLPSGPGGSGSSADAATSPPNKPYDRFNPLKPLPMLRPLVLRGCVDDDVIIELNNELSYRTIDLFIQGYATGPAIVDPGQSVSIGLKLGAEGVWPINDIADVRGNENGTNVHGLFGALIAEPAGTRWLDPETGDPITDSPWAALLDVIIDPETRTPDIGDHPYIDLETDRKNVGEKRADDSLERPDGVKRCFREFCVFIHDEPEIHSGLHTVGDHSLMPLSYRAAPMHNRLPHRMRELVHQTPAKPDEHGPKIDLKAFGWELSEELDEVFVTARTQDGKWLEEIAGEEQHHSSWLFGDPVTHVQRAYAGDPCRVRLIHAGVKETHVYHLHVHEWHAVATDSATPSVPVADAYAPGTGAPTGKGSQLLDSITISPQTAMTIDPLFGSGSRQHAIGDIVWHCHLYPHFHHGMWGLWRSYDRLVDGKRAYPDGSYCPPLVRLPDRDAPPASTNEQPGFPWFVGGTYPAKSPPPPAAKRRHRNGRRILLQMPDATKLERAAMAEGCRKGQSPGALFVDLDARARDWNAAAGLPPPRKISYDIEVRHDPIAYNVDGWYDPRGHHYRPMKATIEEKDEDGNTVVRTETFPHDPKANPEPIFPRANHGDIVEWRQHNVLPAFNADQYDFAQLPVECGLHVHLVKFDVLAADGSSTGWNYLSGASAPQAVGTNVPGEMRNVSLHRWVVDEEFGPCFFHDHLLANFRQRRGLFSALMVQPHGSEWKRHDDKTKRAWSEAQAVIEPPQDSNLPSYREACLAVADYVPLLNRHGKELNPPPILSGMSDPGVMGVNYRCAPLRFRGNDPSAWFSSAVRDKQNFAGAEGDPDTPIILTYPGERLRIRLLQGSHEEQHSFTAHGLRWRRDWGNGKAPLVNQQTLGISEAFTLDINPADASAYGMGDHLWHFGTLDDLWLGNWGLVRVLPPTPDNKDTFPLLPALKGCAPAAEATAPLVPDRNTERVYVVAAQRHEHGYVGDVLTDPWGLIYRAIPCSRTEVEQAIEEELTIEQDRGSKAAVASGDSAVPAPAPKGFEALLAKQPAPTTTEPLVLRALAGEWVRVILVNDILEADDDDRNRRRRGQQPFGTEASPARVPVEHRDRFGHPDRRTVSPRASLHAALLRYDVTADDGSYVGRNPDTTVAARRQRDDAHGMHGGNLQPPDADTLAVGGVVTRADHTGRRNWREYWWWADDKLAPKEATEHDLGQVCYLHDMADIRHHRHHGLIGALVVLPPDLRPYAPGSNSSEPDGWISFSADLKKGDQLFARETFWFMQDGLRFFVNGSHHAPMPDVEPGLDPVDCGQKAVNYRAYPVHAGEIAQAGPLVPHPILEADAGDRVVLRVLGANDKPRQHGIVVHGAILRSASWVLNSPQVGALSGIAPCRAENLIFTLGPPGDHPVRPGSFLWATQQGMWARIRSR